MNPANDAPAWLAITVAIVPPLIGCVILAAIFVCFIHWVDNRAAGDRFAVEHISENADVAAIEATVPDLRDRWTR